jgi:hypothetical protein
MAHVLATALSAAIPMLAARDVDFAVSLLTAANSSKGLTQKQEYWVQKMIERAAMANQPKTVVSVAGIVNLLTKASDKLKFPKIRLRAESGQRVVLSIAGKKSRHCGSVMVTDGFPFGENTYFGRIGTDGSIDESSHMTPEVMALLTAFAADPAGVGSLIGKKFGACCFCSRPLETTESVTAGYGPTCAENYNLPWG